MRDLKAVIGQALDVSLSKLFPDLSPQPQSNIEIPNDKTHGDLASNLALKACKPLKKSPLEIANQIKNYLTENSKQLGIADYIGKIEVQSPGFINFFCTNKILSETIHEILDKKDNFGKSDIGKSKKVQIEFVSANPTGPLSVAHARQAAVGDSLANIMSFLGFKVVREFYINDEGNQIRILGLSIASRYKELLGQPESFPADGYKGSYIYDLAKQMIESSKPKKIEDIDSNLAEFSEFGASTILKIIKKELEDFKVKFDIWTPQSALTKKGEVTKIVEFLRKKGFIYDKDGAVWFRSTEFGDDKDRVLVKSDGTFTYLTPDIAYHQDKFRRGFDWVINIWGPDHHGYIGRIKAAVQALGRKKEDLSVIIVQLATLFKDGAPVPMSTRAGQYVTLQEVLDEIGPDVSRFFFLMRRVDSHLDFDLSLAKKQSPENPVYYIQYAHARISSIIKKSGKVDFKKADLNLLKEPEELDLVKILAQFPEELEACVKMLDPFNLVSYLQQLAAVFHKFYDTHKVISEDEKLMLARLDLVEATRLVLANGLRLLNVSVPEKM
ncbi:MAG: arginine--tRNA ligase [Candidatus Omnitrophica bacterium]|nr:arginine--tRNA ligase [Candidatus Omnitrophota bacterium]HOX53857.1 arginine--tRNA ligase [Candidatus Omnitrophota bacterium]